MELQHYFNQAELAFAAYGTYSPSMDKDALIAVLMGEGVKMPEAQAKKFAETWEVVNQFTGDFDVSATIFKEKATGKQCLAIRGTEGLKDIACDVILALGLPSYLNPQFLKLHSQIQSWIDDKVLSPGFTVAGHSLGGYLAMAVGTWFSESGQVFTYNAPGIGGTVGNALDHFRQVFGLDGIALAPNIANLRGTGGLSVIAGLGAQLSPPILVETEGSLNPQVNHSIITITDSLAVYALFAQLDPSLNTGAGLAKIGEILKASANITSNTLESAVSALGKLFGKNYALTETTHNDLYLHIQELQSAGTFASLAGKVTIELSNADTATQARTDFGALLPQPLLSQGLGGGLAALVAVMFDEKAVSFDQAPFRNSALFYDTTDDNGPPSMRSVAQDLRAYLEGRVAPAMLTRLDAYIAAGDRFNLNPIPGDTLAGREAKVINYNVQGEILSGLPFSRIGVTPQRDIANHGPMIRRLVFFLFLLAANLPRFRQNRLPVRL